MGKKSGKKVDKAFIDGVNYAFDLVEESFKHVRGIGPVKQKEIMVALRELADSKYNKTK